MVARKVMVAAIVVAAIIIVAGVLVVVYPSLTSNKPSTTPGTSFISTSIVGNSLGGTWQKAFYVSGGAHNVNALYAAYGNSIGSTIMPTSPVPSDAAGSLIAYSQSSTGANLEAFYAYLPNSSAASQAYSNLTASLQLNSSIVLSSGTTAGASYTYANITGLQNATQLIYSYSGRYLLGFLYMGTNYVAQSGMVSLVTNQVKVLSSTSSPPYPSHIVTPTQVNSALSLSVDSYAYAIANVTNVTSLLPSYNLSSVTGVSGTSSLENQFVENITSVGLAAFTDTSKNVTAGSVFVTFKSSTFSSALYEDLNALASGNSAYSSSYHTGTVSGKQYFFFNTSVNTLTGTQTSLLFCIYGGTLIVQFVTASSLYGYSAMTGLASAQISDL